MEREQGKRRSGIEREMQKIKKEEKYTKCTTQGANTNSIRVVRFLRYEILLLLTYLIRWDFH